MPELAERDKNSEISSSPSSFELPQQQTSDCGPNEDSSSHSCEKSYYDNSTGGHNSNGMCTEKNFSSESPDPQYEENESE